MVSFFAAHHIHGSVHKVLQGMHLPKKVTVHNYLGNISFQCTVKEPKNLEELVDVMVKAKQEKQNVRAVGAFHSWSYVPSKISITIAYWFGQHSPVCVTAGYLVKTDNLVGTQPTPTATLKDPSGASAYYDVLCGTSWKEAAVALEKKGRALTNIGGYSGSCILETTTPFLFVKMLLSLLRLARCWCHFNWGSWKWA